MEKELNCPTLFDMEIPSEHLQNCYFQPNWDTPNDQNDPFESALSSMVSSPTTTSNGGGMILGDGMMIRELIGRLGSISDSGEISHNSTNTSCYNTPLNSPPKFDLSSLMMKGQNGHFTNQPPNFAPFNPDPGFVERAAKFSCFGNNNRSVPKLEYGNLSRVSSNQSIRVGGGVNLQIDVNSGVFEKKFGGISRASTPENGDFEDSREGSSVSEQNPGGEIRLKPQNDANSRKRKSIPKPKSKESSKVDAEKEESNAKRSKSDDEEGKKVNAGDSKNKEVAKTEPPKDYIHVRARRGQATDSHSLAERVRREKISERMKFLQDLVPGCNKVTGKATVLDEIINYVQSLQSQVEFLSMKLSTINPRMEFNMEALLSKDMFQSRGLEIQQTMYQLYQNSAQTSPHGIQLPQMHGFGDSITQAPTFWENDLQSIVQMGIIAQNQTENLTGTLPNAETRVEL